MVSLTSVVRFAGFSRLVALEDCNQRDGRAIALVSIGRRARERELCRFRSWCLGLQPKTGVVLSVLLQLPRLRPAVHGDRARYVQAPEEPTRVAHRAGRWSRLPSANCTPKKLGAHQAGTQYRSVPPSIRKINSIEANRGERPEFRS
jgi:hypothetical protein